MNWVDRPGSSARRSTAAVCAPATMKRASLPTITATRSACGDRLLGPRRAMQYHLSRRDQPYGRLHEYWRYLYWLHHAGLPRQVLTILQAPTGLVGLYWGLPDRRIVHTAAP